jgi:hypothetical protein
MVAVVTYYNALFHNCCGSAEKHKPQSNSQPTGRELNPVPSEYKARTLITTPIYSVQLNFRSVLK